jgi:hypothetical protein
MRIRMLAAGLIILVAAAMIMAAPMAAVAKKGDGGSGGGGGGGKDRTAGNCLSFPVFWAEGVPKVLRGDPYSDPVLEGKWWYWWGTDSEDKPLSCAPDPDDNEFCDDGNPGTLGIAPGDGESEIYKAYLQKDLNNIWQAWSGTGIANRLVVDWIDWGDNLESVDWYTTSQVRTEVVLFKDNPDLDNPWLEYKMLHTSGWGIDEVHGLAATLEGVPVTGDGTRATVYSHCARLTIQKLLVDRDDERLDDLTWVPKEGWTEPEGYPDDLINPPIFNKPVWESGDGPGYYSAEINVKGRIIYGYTWNVRQLNDLTGTPPSAAGDYRVTFSFDDYCGLNNQGPQLNTFFTDASGNPVTQILLPTEVEIAAVIATLSEESDDSGGGVAVLDFDDGLTYMDIRILQRGGGSGGSGGGGGGGGRRS